MPNTLAHLGFQGFASRLAGNIDPKWVAFGCIIPDIPWIFQRIVTATTSFVNPLDLRLYVAIQASLFFSLLLSAAIASLAKNSLSVFAILGLNSFVHLLIDACQTKWANGVHFLAPLLWEMMNFGFFWPEHVLTHLLTALGILYIVATWRLAINKPPELANLNRWRIICFVVLLIAYIFMPFFYMDDAERNNIHFVKTLRHSDERAGRHIEFDRPIYKPKESFGVIIPFTGEQIIAEGIVINKAANVSIKGEFMSDNKIRVAEYHIHDSAFRDGASYFGLIYVVLIWGYALLRMCFCLYSSKSLSH